MDGPEQGPHTRVHAVADRDSGRREFASARLVHPSGGPDAEPQRPTRLRAAKR